MSAKKIIIIFGTRPEAIKLAPIINAMKEDSRFNLKVIFTGQHKEMVLPIMEWFGIKPDYTLDVMEHKQPLAKLSGKLLNGLHSIIEKEKPDTVIIQGDTTTTFMAALTAFYAYDFYVRSDTDEGKRQYIEIAHIEAGLRTYNKYSPFPEEANRQMVSHLATHHFAPTLTAATALYDENITENVFITGNTEIDSLFNTLKVLEKNPRNPVPEIPNDKDFVLITGHRRENYGQGFDNICKAISTLATDYPNTYFIYPVHLNQHVQKPVNKLLGHIKNVVLTKPMFYPDFISLLKQCKLVLTDSGGVQESAPSLGKPVLVMRDLTERPEAVLSGTAKVVGTSAEKIVTETSKLLDDPIAYKKMAEAVNPYGDGQATKRILNILAGNLSEENHFTVTS